MRFILPLLVAFTCIASLGAEPEAEAVSSSKALAELTAWLGTARETRPALADAAFAKVPLTKDAAAKAGKALWEDHVAFFRATRAAELAAKVIHIGEKEMKFEIVSFGEKAAAPKGGRSLFISLHGGGGAPPEVNESQWRNQIQLARGYRPAEGLYVAPRAPTNSWNLWHENHIDGLFDRLIADLVALENVNPNRVYVLGYSAGGDGVYQLGPRMADRWAAASMMAGHPNSASQLNLRNVPFAIQVGANDGAYGRNKVAADWGKKLDALQAKDAGGYAHFTELHEGKGHWMDMQDRKAIPWMEKFTRDPRPEHVVWRRDSTLHKTSYWLALPAGVEGFGQEIHAVRSGQKITLQTTDVTDMLIRLSDAMLDLDAPVTVLAGEKTVFTGRAARTIGTLARTLAERSDPELMFSAELAVHL
ncbi:MAG: hypothetical protein K8R23_05255 [Chthoniobacter sp.]|nr:hypothetical protein [Chthoniobacter sp.]